MLTNIHPYRVTINPGQFCPELHGVTLHRPQDITGTVECRVDDLVLKVLRLPQERFVTYEERDASWLLYFGLARYEMIELRCGAVFDLGWITSSRLTGRAVVEAMHRMPGNLVRLDIWLLPSDTFPINQEL